jgi:hypothetical protein
MTNTDFIDLLLEKMADGGLPQPVIDLVAGNAGRIYQGYTLHDPHDIVILNNKIIYLRDLADQAGITDGSGPVPAPTAGMMLQVMRSKA